MEPREFSFGDSSVASNYDTELVPVLFDPWAERLIDDYGPWDGLRVLDLASGTGIVAQKLALAVGRAGVVYAADINPEMLELAKARCRNSEAEMHYILCPADCLEVADESVDFAVCQQGFQFFPDKVGAAREICRVLKPGGTVVATTWLPVSDCEYFGVICDALEANGHTSISEMMRLPFDHMPGSELETSFAAAGFATVRLQRQEGTLVLSGGLDRAVRLAYSTPIGPRLVQLPQSQRVAFEATLSGLLSGFSQDGSTVSRMATNVVRAVKEH
jgi:ubiquinone/menaquinone biosynthesis C-methylase UbiE